MQTERLAIEEGALLNGKVEAGKQPAKSAETKAAAAAATSKSSETASLSSGNCSGLSDELPEQTRHRNWKRDEPRCFAAGSFESASADPGDTRSWRKAPRAPETHETTRVSNGLKELLVESRWLGPRQTARSGASVANHAEFLHRARIPRLFGRYPSRMERVS